MAVSTGGVGNGDGGLDAVRARAAQAGVESDDEFKVGGGTGSEG